MDLISIITGLKMENKRTYLPVELNVIELYDVCDVVTASQTDNPTGLFGLNDDCTADDIFGGGFNS